MRLLLASVVLPLTLLAAPAHAAGGKTLYEVEDRTGDVRMLSQEGTDPDLAEKRSIDLGHFEVTKRARSVRFSFTLASITTSRAFDQVVEVQFSGTGRDYWVMAASGSPQHRGQGLAYFSPGLDGDATVLCRPHVAVKGTTVKLDVPLKCVPGEAGVLRALTYTTLDDGDGVGASEDQLRVPGKARLG